MSVYTVRRASTQPPEADALARAWLRPGGILQHWFPFLASDNPIAEASAAAPAAFYLLCAGPNTKTLPFVRIISMKMLFPLLCFGMIDV